MSLTGRPEPALSRAKGIQAKVPDNLRKLHPAVRQTLAGCKRLQADYLGFLNYAGHSGIETHVSRKQLRRAMRIAQGFIDAVIARGHTVALSDDGKSSVVLHVNGAALGFSLSESITEVPGRKDVEGNQLFRQAPSGRLSLRIFALPRYLSRSKRHRDGRTFPLERRLALAIPDLETIAQQALSRQQEENERDRLRNLEVRRKERREQVKQRNTKIAAALEQTLSSLKLVDNALDAARRIRERCPGSGWANSLATWLERAARKLGSPKRLAHTIPPDVWAALAGR